MNKSTTVTSFGKGHEFDLTDYNPLTNVYYSWKNFGDSVLRYWTDDQANKGKEAHIRMMNAKIEGVRKGLQEKLEIMITGDGTGNSAADWEGLKNLVSSSPTSSSTVGGHDQANFSDWQNQQSASSSPAAVNLIDNMTTLFNTCERYGGTKLIIFDQTSYELYEKETLEYKHTVNKIYGDASVQHVSFKGVPVIWSPRITSGYGYFLDTDFLELIIDPAVDFVMGPWKYARNSIDVACQIVTRGNFVATNRKPQGVLTGIAA